MKKQIALKVIQEAALDSRVVRSREKSDGQTLICFGGIETHPDLFCGGCGALLAGGTLLSDIGHDALKCNACGSFNIAS